MSNETKSIYINTRDTSVVSPYIFGHNLEHIRAAMAGGLSAQMFRNRKFAGNSSKNEGCPAEWFAIGGKNAFLTLYYDYIYDIDQTSIYVKNWNPEKFSCRDNEKQVLVVQNLTGQVPCGIGQHEIPVLKGKNYEFRMVTHCNEESIIHVQITNRYGDTIYAQQTVTLEPGEWQTSEFTLMSDRDDADACVRFTIHEHSRVSFGALSMLPEGHFHGMRKDVVEHLKEIGVSMLRWPGGCYALDYRWQDGLLPVDMRAPIQSFHAMVIQPYTNGYDDHEMGTDEFIALCREIGAEPYISINPVWCSPQENAAWVEYCNGSVNTEYGRLRAERGHTEPYQVKFWALGNELGYTDAEGPQTPEEYAALVRRHADAMLAVTPDLKLFSSGPHPNKEWAEKSAKALADVADYVSFHLYSPSPQNFSTQEATRQSCEILFSAPLAIQKAMEQTREYLGEGLHISFDEWNQWYAWFRPGSVSQGIYVAEMLHMLLHESVRLDVPVCCYYQPVGEGAIEIKPYESTLTASGQAFSFLKTHRDGTLCKVENASIYEAAATLREDIVTVTLVNTDLYENQCFSMNICGEPVEARVLQSDSVLPYSHFTESELAFQVENNALKVTLPPHSIGKICFKM